MVCRRKSWGSWAEGSENLHFSEIRSVDWGVGGRRGGVGGLDFGVARWEGSKNALWHCYWLFATLWQSTVPQFGHGLLTLGWLMYSLTLLCDLSPVLYVPLLFHGYRSSLILNLLLSKGRLPQISSWRRL